MTSDSRADTRTMRAMILHEWNGRLSEERRPVPVPQAGEVLVRVVACGAGLTLENVRSGRLGGTVPRIMGHEFGGVVDSVGAATAPWAPGDRVTASFNLICGRCRWCAGGRETLCENFAGFLGAATDGAFAEYVLVPAHNLVAVPDGLPLRVAGFASDAVATPYHAARERARILPGQRIAVIGAGGGVGVHMLGMARAFGARVIAVERAEHKLAALGELPEVDVVVHATDALTADALITAAGGPLDSVFDFVSNESTVALGMAALGRGGTFVVIGAGASGGTFLSMDMIVNEKSIIGSRNTTRAEIGDALALVADGVVPTHIGASFPLAELQDAFDAIRDNSVFGRIVIDVSDEYAATMPQHTTEV